MSPATQFAAVATITFAILGFQIVALAGLGLTLALLLYGFRTPPAPGAAVAPPEEGADADPPPPPARTPNEEASRVDG